MSQKRIRLSRKESQEQTRQRLLDAAIVVFTEKGYAKTRLDDVAEEAGYSKGAVYSNFKSKEDLALAVLDQFRGQRLEEIADQILTNGHDEQFWIERAQGGTHVGNLLSIELWVHAHHNEALRDKLVERNRHAYAALAKLLSGKDEPLEKHKDFVNLISALSTGFTVHYALDPDPKLMELWSTVATKLFDEMRAE